MVLIVVVPLEAVICGNPAPGMAKYYNLQPDSLPQMLSVYYGMARLQRPLGEIAQHTRGSPSGNCMHYKHVDLTFVVDVPAQMHYFSIFMQSKELQQ